MSNPYKFNLEGLSVVVYANNRADANEIFTEKLLQHDAKVRADAVDEFLEVLVDNSEDFSAGNKIVESSLILDFITIAEQLKEKKK